MISPQALAELLGLISDGTITDRTAKRVFDRMWNTGESAKAIVESQGLAQIRDINVIDSMCRFIVQANAQQANAYRAGKKKIMDFFVGQAMKITEGRGDPGLARELLADILAEHA